MNPIDRAILYIAPVWAAKRLRGRAMAAAYEAAAPSRLRTRSRDYGSGNAATEQGALPVRVQARALERNHDIARNALNVLVQNVVGAAGIGVEFQPRRLDGDIDEPVAEQLRVLFLDWMRRPEVTYQHDWASAQRITARSWFRDGEVLAHELVGPVPYLDHGTRVPFSLELIEADLLPFDHTDLQRGILQGVERNAWGRPVAYHLYKSHPGDAYAYGMPELKRVPAERVRHLKLVDRIGQVRGVSMFASVLTRLDDLKDYEESERIAAKIAASMAAFIIKGDPASYNESTGIGLDGQPLPERQMRFQPGMVFDNLRPGEQVGTVDTKRPSVQLEPYRNGQLRAAAGGMCVSFSSLSRNYDGTYSAQRQELVEQYGAYGVLSMEFIQQFVRPAVERFIATAYASGRLTLSADSNPAALTDAMYVTPAMPWIDPKKEADAMEIMERNVWMSGPEIIRRRGANPRDVLDQSSRWREQRREWGLAQAEATGAAPAAGASETDAEAFVRTVEPYSAAVRSGVITPQQDDERFFRERAGVPAMSGAVTQDWSRDPVRRPITLQQAQPTPRTEGEQTPPPDNTNDTRSSRMRTSRAAQANAHPARDRGPVSGVPSLLRVNALAGGDAELLIYGPIGESWWSESTTARDVVQQLQGIAASTITVRINSEGGSVQDGLAIYNALKRHPARIVVTIDGMAASIASLITMAGDEVIMPANTLMMIHAPWVYAGGNAQDLEDAAEMLRTHERSMATSYADKSGKPVDDVLALFRDYRDHYYTASEAVAEGFADRMLATADEPAEDTAAAALIDTLVHNLNLTAQAAGKAPAHVLDQMRARLGAALTPARFAAFAAARRSAIVQSIQDPTMKDHALNVMAQVQAGSGSNQPGTPATQPAPSGTEGAAPATPAAVLQAPAVTQQPAQPPANDPVAALAARNTRLRSVFAGFRDRPEVRDLEAECLADTTLTVEAAQQRLLSTLGTGGAPAGGAAAGAAGDGVGPDLQHAAARDILLVRAGVIQGPDAERVRNGNPYNGRTLVDIAEASLIRAGIRTRDLTREQIAQRALAMQGTGDFPVLLENVLHKILLGGYNLSALTWSRFCAIGTLSDYRPHYRYHDSSFSSLLPVNEHGEYQNGTLGDGQKESIRGTRKGRILQITPEVIVNDDLSAFTTPARKLGQAAGRTIENDVYEVLLANPLMSDGVALFHASRNNIGTAGAPSVSAFEQVKNLMRSQKDVGGNDFLDISPAIWLGGLNTSGTATTVNSNQFDPDVSGKFQVANRVQGTFRDIVDTPRIEGAAWYAFADPNEEAVLEVAFLDGRREPTLEQEINFRTDGISWKVVHRYGVGAVGYRGAVRNAGAGG